MSRDEERARHLLMMELDGEIGPEEKAELERLLADDPELAAEARELSKVKEISAMMALKNPPDAMWAGYWNNVYNRIERGIGWILVSLGAMVLLGFGLWQAVGEILADTSMPEFLKWAIFALGAGSIVLLISVAREKLFTYRHDPYKEVQR